MSAFMSAFASLVGAFADLLQPLFQNASTAAAIVLFTALVRLAVHPLAGGGTRAEGPHQAPAADRRTAQEARQEPGPDAEGAHGAPCEGEGLPLSGCLPSLLQMPAFFLLYHLFSSQRIGGDPNSLLGHELFGAPLGERWHDALAEGGVFGQQGLVYVGLFVIVAAVATFNYGRTKRQMAANPMTPATGPDGQPVPGMGAMTKVMPLMSFLTLVSVAYVPLAAALYIVTSTTWTAIERAYLYRESPAAEAAVAPAV